MKYLFLFPIICFLFNLSAQSPYELNWKKEVVYLGTGVGVYTVSYVLEFGFIEPLSTSKIYSLDRASVNTFDRNATFNYSLNSKRGSDILMASSYTFSLLFLSSERTRPEFGKIMAMYGETLLLVGSLTSLSKRAFLRPRPYVYNELVPLSAKQRNDSRYAFFSGHAAFTAANSVFAAKVFADYFPDSKWKPIVWGAAILIPASTGYLRVSAGKHYPTDIIVGVVVGSTIGYLVPHFHRKSERHNFSTSLSLSGVQFTYQF
jgi:membrane-associated phospholipid phosphatase